MVVLFCAMESSDMYIFVFTIWHKSMRSRKVNQFLYLELLYRFRQFCIKIFIYSL